VSRKSGYGIVLITAKLLIINRSSQLLFSEKNGEISRDAALTFIGRLDQECDWKDEP
jgi:hypothetical protein